MSSFSSKMEFPKLEGDNIITWLTQCNKWFQRENINCEYIKFEYVKENLTQYIMSIQPKSVTPYKDFSEMLIQLCKTQDLEVEKQTTQNQDSKAFNDKVDELMDMIRTVLQKFHDEKIHKEKERVEFVLNNLEKFTYQPSSGATFKRWYNCIAQIFENAVKILPDQHLIELLLNSFGDDEFKKVCNFLLPMDPRNMTFEELLKTLESLFGETKTYLQRWYDFLSTESTEEDAFKLMDEIDRELNNLEFEKMTIDKFKMLLAALRMRWDTKFDKYRKLLLEKGDTCSFSEMREMSKELCRIETDCAVGQKEIKSCFRCGEFNHTPDQCFYLNTKCYCCKKRGHIKMACPKMKKRSK